MRVIPGCNPFLAELEHCLSSCFFARVEVWVVLVFLIQWLYFESSVSSSALLCESILGAATFELGFILIRFNPRSLCLVN